jgi:hypothetical protein
VANPLMTILPLLADVIDDAGPGPGLDKAADSAAAASAGLFHWPTHWPMQGDLLAWCHNTGPGVAVLLIIGGIVYLLFGYYIFKALVTLNAAILGAYFGALLAAAATWPVMKYAVAVMGGIFGALLGATVWRLFDLDPNFAWSGAMTGLVFFGLLSFLLFRQCIMTYTSLQGSVMLVFGILALIFKYDSISSTLNHSFELKPFLLPLSIFIPTLLGFIYQQAVFPAAAPQGGPPKK